MAVSSQDSMPLAARPDLILPDIPKIFQERSRRFADLAVKHPLSDWLIFLGKLSSIQHDLIQRFPCPMPDHARLQSALEHRLPPIAASSWIPAPGWRETLADLVRELMPHAPPPACETLGRLLSADGNGIDTLAKQVLQGELDGSHAGALIFIAAALQIHWTALASGLDRKKIAAPLYRGVCPCCGFLPVAGMVRTDGDIPHRRYLHCALCNTEWNLMRVTCSSCGDTNQIGYYHLEGSDGSVRAETCDNCHTYLKMIYREKVPLADPVADDVASLSLDLLVQEAGYSRTSPNLFFTSSYEEK